MASQSKKIPISADILAAIAAMQGLQGSAVLGGEHHIDASVFSVTTEQQREAERKAAEDAVLKRQLIPGNYVEGQGVFICEWHPVDREGNSLNKAFNVFAARHDIEDKHGDFLTVTYNEAVQYVKKLQDLDGYAGEAFADEIALHAALINNKYKGGWIIPPLSVLAGSDGDGRKSKTDSLFTLRETGILEGTLSNKRFGGKSEWYWSCTTGQGDRNAIWDVSFINGYQAINEKTPCHLNCRLVRLVEIKA